MRTSSTLMVHIVATGVPSGSALANIAHPPSLRQIGIDPELVVRRSGPPYRYSIVNIGIMVHGSIDKMWSRRLEPHRCNVFPR